MSTSACFQCGLPVAASPSVTADIGGKQRAFCCIGCRAVAQLINDAGLKNYFRFRDDSIADTAAIVGKAANDFSYYDDEKFQDQFVVSEPGDVRCAGLVVEGIHCAACAWLIERYIGAQGGVASVSVNSSNHRCQLRWHSRQTSLSQMLPYFLAIGYRAVPATHDDIQQQITRENRQALMRLGVAGFGMMQVGMLAVALYAGALQDMTEVWRQLLRWVSAMVATPVVFFAAMPFFRNAFTAVRFFRLSMDVPVALAIGLAYVLSCWATVSGAGDVYFDSVSMFTFFLSTGRYVEMRIRHRNEQSLSRTASLLPVVVQRIKRAGDTQKLPHSETLPVDSLVNGDWTQVREGETIPCDGCVVEGEGHVDESLLTGEPHAIDKTAGDAVIAGSIIADGSLVVEAQHLKQQTRIAAIQRITDRALQEKPRQLVLADRLAGYFVATVLFAAGLAGLYWYNKEPHRALWVVLSILVVTCPCALSLATPVALTAAVHRLRRLGLLIVRGHAVETLARVTRVAFDKTGTLTEGKINVSDVVIVAGYSRERVLKIIAAMESGSTHPIARAFAQYPTDLSASEVKYYRGQGVVALVEGHRYRFGTEDFALALISDSDAANVTMSQPQPMGPSPLTLSCHDGVVARVIISDKLREESKAALHALQQQGLTLSILSGDGSATVASVAAELGVRNFQAELKPEQKMERVKQWQSQHDVVAMVGDGLNDLPVLVAADVSLAMSGAADLTQIQADSVLLRNDLRIVSLARRCAVFCRSVIRQNLYWAVLYNIVALPLAIAGMVPPYVAAIGMSLSSLLVVLNSARITRLQLPLSMPSQR